MQERRDLVRQQDDEFAAALAADRERERRRLELREAEEMVAEAAALPEPEAGPGVLPIRFLLPDGRSVVRRFRRRADMEEVHTFLLGLGVWRAELILPQTTRPLPECGVTVENAVGGMPTAVLVRNADGKTICSEASAPAPTLHD